MKKIIYLLGFLFIISNAYAQNRQLKMEITSVKSTKDSIAINIDVINVSDKKILVYLPDLQDICSSLMHIKFVDLKNNKFCEVLPCTYNANLKFLEINNKNSFILNSSEKKNIDYKFSKSNISPYLKKKYLYKVFVGWYFKDQYIKTSAENYFNDDVESNYVLFKND